MDQICGICEPGAQLEIHELAAMYLAAGLKQDRRESPIGGNGALLGAGHRLRVAPLALEHGLYVAVDADLTNYNTLLAEYQGSNGSAISSVEDLVSVLYARHGLNFVEKLEGAFSLALWDAQRQRLALAIDRFGFKTMYWSLERGRVSFSSRLDALANKKERLEVDPAAVMQLLVHTVVPAPLTSRASNGSSPGLCWFTSGNRLERHAIGT